MQCTCRFHVALHLLSNRSQMTLKCGNNKKVAHKAITELSLMLLPDFEVFCDLSLNRRKAKCYLFVLFNEELKSS